MPVAEAQARISGREFTEWIAFQRLEPFESERGDARMAILASIIANANRDQKKHRKPFKPEEFIPKWDADAERQSVEQQVGMAKMLHEFFSTENKNLIAENAKDAEKKEGRTEI